MKEYTLEEIKGIIREDKVDIRNISDIMYSLRPLEWNDDVQEIFVSLSNNDKLPTDIRNNFREIVNNVPLYHENEKEIGEGNSGSNASSGAGTTDDKSNEILFESPEISTIEMPTQTPREEGHQSTTDDDGISLANDAALGLLTSYAVGRGVNVLSSNPGLDEPASISFELTYESKPYVDNLLLSLHENNENIDVSMTRNESTHQEMLTITLPNQDMLDQNEQNKKMFERVHSILQNTDKSHDYEKDMPVELQNLKDKFVMDDPNIPNDDFEVGYKRENGETAYYLVADSKEKALELAESMGYEVKKDRGGNVFELDTDGKIMKDTKLDKATENINDIDEVKDPENGLPDVDINYNRKHYSEEDTQKVVNFIENSRDVSNMAVVQIDCPSTTENQRIVHLASEDGIRDTIVFNNGQEFDNYTLPKIASAFNNGSTINPDNITKVEYQDDKASYEALSSDNTYLRLNNFETSTIDRTDQSLTKTENSITNQNTNTNVYQKSLGSYPNNNSVEYNSEAAKTSFLTIVAFLLCLLVGFLLIYFIYG